MKEFLKINPNENFTNIIVYIIFFILILKLGSKPNFSKLYYNSIYRLVLDTEYVLIAQGKNFRVISLIAVIRVELEAKKICWWFIFFENSNVQLKSACVKLETELRQG